jgi:hypothetical protein
MDPDRWLRREFKNCLESKWPLDHHGHTSVEMSNVLGRRRALENAERLGEQPQQAGYDGITVLGSHWDSSIFYIVAERPS